MAMVFYYKELLRPGRPKFIPPAVVDESFYLDIKKRLDKDNDFTFRSEINFWRSYLVVLIEFLLCFFSACLLIIWYYTGVTGNYSLLFPLLFIVVAIKPSLYFIGQMHDYIRYVKEERQFHSEFKKAVQDSLGFEDFRKRLYHE